MNLFSGRPQRGHIGDELLSAYLDNQVMAGERARIESHLAGCPACQAQLSALRQVTSLLHALPTVAVPRAFTLSEARAGIRGPAARPAWYGGMLRGLGTVAAVALIAVVATTLLRRPTWTPSATIARVAPTAAGPAAAAPLASRAATETTATESAAAEQPTVAEAPAPTAAPAAPVQAQAVAEQPAEAPTQSEAAPAQPAALPAPPTEAPAPEADTAAMAKSAQQETAPAPMADSTAATMAMPAPEAAPGVAAAGFGRGGGPASATAPEALTPAPPPPLAAISNVFPVSGTLAYADDQGVWGIDRASGLRQLVVTPGAIAPLISPDKQWVAYRIAGTPYVELWAAPWNGQAARRLLSEQDLSKDDLGSNYGERRIASVRWAPGHDTLLVTTIAVPKAGDAPPKMEMWSLDVVSGSLQYVVDLGEADSLYYAPDGSKFALLQRGTGAQSTGSLLLYSTGVSDGQKLLEFPGGPAVPGFDSQVSWLPDGSGLWVAIPDPTVDFSLPAHGVTLYRVPLDGEAKTVGHLDGLETFWSPDGTRLVYLRPSSQTPGARDLVLANADGSNLQVYATFVDGFFGGWSSDSERFLYYADNYVYAGGPGTPPQPLGNAPSVINPQWLTPGEIVYCTGGGGGYALILRPLDGEAAALTWLPREVEYDVSAP